MKVCLPRPDSGHPGPGRRAHSHCSLARLGVRGQRQRGSSASLARSEGEDVTYVWKEGRVQLHVARSGPTTPDLSRPGHTVQYMWRNGNVQRVVRGSNHVRGGATAALLPPLCVCVCVCVCVYVCV